MKADKTLKFNSNIKPTWCPGCGDYSVWHALKSSFVELSFEPHSLCIVYDIGCSGNMCSFINAYGIHGLHGRSIPVAAGVHMAQPELPVIVVGGDGGLFGEGLSHFVNACRANYNITIVAHNNQVYGLTTGQTSPTTMKGVPTKSNPHGGYDIPVDPVSLALLSGATFVGQGFSGEIDHLSALITKAISHKGLSFINVWQPCVTFNKVNTYEWFRERIYMLDQPFTDVMTAIGSVHDQDRKPLGVIFEKTDQADYVSNLDHVKDKNLVKSVGTRDVSGLLPLFQ
jgi:2-oxoglutarate/2-oxoacid ferredoxin oxidoreductase subunit beta